MTITWVSEEGQKYCTYNYVCPCSPCKHKHSQKRPELELIFPDHEKDSNPAGKAIKAEKIYLLGSRHGWVVPDAVRTLRKKHAVSQAEKVKRNTRNKMIAILT